MVSLSAVQSSNSLIASSLPPRLVAVFVGATSGIGEATLKQFAKHTRQSRAYFIGRRQEAGDRIVAECKTLNPEGEFIYVKADVGLIRIVDDVCREIRGKEEAVNLLFLSAGTLVGGTETSENLHLLAALTYYSRIRFIVNLLPLLQKATALRRVVSVFAGGKEGPIDTNDFQALHGSLLSFLSLRGHMASLITLSLEAVAKKAPTVSFVHDFPGPVNTGMGDGVPGVTIWLMVTFFRIMGRWICIPIEECGERHLFLATSAKYSPSVNTDASGVPVADGVATAKGTDGEMGSGVYSVGSDGESGLGAKGEKLFVGFRDAGMGEQVWQHTAGEFKRITGQERI